MNKCVWEFGDYSELYFPVSRSCFAEWVQDNNCKQDLTEPCPYCHKQIEVKDENKKDD